MDVEMDANKTGHSFLFQLSLIVVVKNSNSIATYQTYVSHGLQFELIGKRLALATLLRHLGRLVPGGRKVRLG